MNIPNKERFFFLLLKQAYDFELLAFGLNSSNPSNLPDRLITKTLNESYNFDQ